MGRKLLSVTFAFAFLFLSLFLIPNSEAEEVLTGGSEHIHLNMKEASDLSPETWGDITKEAVKENPPRSWSSQTADLTRTREWKDVGTWTAAKGNEFDISLSGPVKFNLWWRETDSGQADDYNAQVQYRFRLNLDGQSAAFYTDENNGDSHECQESEPCEWTGQVGNINFSSAPKGSIFEIEIEYWSFSDIEIYYDNVSFDSGAAFGADAIKFGNTQISGRTVSFNFVQAWNTNVNEAITGDYITLMVGGVDLINSEQKNGFPKIEDGVAYDFNGTEIKSTKITWYVDDEYAKLDQTAISFSLTKKSSQAAPPILINTADILTQSEEDSEEEGVLGLPGFNLIFALISLILVTKLRREV